MLFRSRHELKLAASRLRAGGRLIVLAPAHQWLFTPFDAALGHFRRYNRQMLHQLSPIGLRFERLIYVDAMGLAASIGNLFLRQSMPTAGQVRFWDSWLVPVSRVVDPLFGYTAGKSIVAVWCKLREGSDDEALMIDVAASPRDGRGT